MVPIRFRATAFGAAALGLAGLMAGPGGASAPTHTATAVVETAPAEASGDTVDDPAIWVNPADPAASLVIGSNHKESTVEVYDLAGRRLQRIETKGTNNVDARPGFVLGGSPADLVGVAGGGSRSGKMTFFRIDPQRRTLTNVTAGGTVRLGGAYGFCMYRSPVTGTYYAFGVSPAGRVEQIELFDDGGLVNGRLVRTIEVDPEPVENSGGVRDLEDHLEGCVADDGTARLYIGEENRGIWEYGAEPGDPAGQSDRTLVDSTEPHGGHIAPQVEGLTIVYGPGTSGFLIASSQGDFTYTVYRREPPHEFLRKVSVAAGPNADGCQRTDGIDARRHPPRPGVPPRPVRLSGQHQHRTGQGQPELQVRAPGTDGAVPRWWLRVPAPYLTLIQPSRSLLRGTPNPVSASSRYSARRFWSRSPRSAVATP